MRSIIHLANCPSRNSPTDFSDESFVFHPGEAARSLPRWQFLLDEDGRCGVAFTYPIPGLHWRHNRRKHADTPLDHAATMALFENAIALPTQFPKECLRNEELWADMTERGNSITRDKQNNSLCLTIGVSERGQWLCYYAMPEASPALLGSKLYRVVSSLLEPYLAIDASTGGGSHLASAYGTRGLIFRDEGRDAEAVDWLRMAYEEHQKQPSPNLKTIADDLEHEIAALKRLGRLEEAAVAEKKLESVCAAIKCVPQVNRDLSALDGPVQGDVLVELSFGSQPGGLYTRKEPARLARQLSDTIETGNVGSYGGHVVIPESITLMFYGADAEALFRVLEPSLTSEPMCAGARVTIRQGEGHREVVLPSRPM